VQAVRRTAKGELLVILNKVSDPKTVELQTTMKAVLGNNVDVRALTETMLIEVKDIDETTDKADILCAVRSQFDVELPESAVVNLRVAYGGTQTATLRVMPDIGRRPLEKGKIRLGWTWCRVSPKLTPKRCFKCMEFNHIAGNCRVQEDCSICCYNCSAKEHQARGCKAKDCCMLCKRKKEKDCDHPKMSGKCPYFRRAMQGLRGK